LFTGSLVEIEYTLNFHPLTRVMYLRTLNNHVTVHIQSKVTI